MALPITVALADDSLLIREGLIRLLESAPGVKVVAVSADYPGLLDAVKRERPDVVLTDIRMPPTGRTEGVELANALRDSHPQTAVIVLSQFAEPIYAQALLERGAARRGYLLKESLGDRKQLVAAIEQVAEGGSAIDPKIVEVLLRHRGRAEDSQLRRLTPREREVLAEVATGKSNAAIAHRLVITKRAVERHIGSIFAKLDLPAEQEASRRVSATLLFLAERDGG